MPGVDAIVAIFAPWCVVVSCAITAPANATTVAAASPPKAASAAFAIEMDRLTVGSEHDVAARAWQVSA